MAASGVTGEEREEFASLGIAFTDFDAQRSLASRRTHDFRGDDLLDQFGFAEALQAGGREDDRVVLSLFEFAQAGVDVASEGMNIEIRANGF